jgi:peptide/nickel transport system substrate-binding protein
MRRRLGAWLCGFLVWGAFPAVGGGQEPALRVGVPAVPATLDPGALGDGPESLLARQVFDTLVQWREGGSDVEPALAARWVVSRDGLAWAFRLREGVRFQDGTPLTAQHVAWSLERAIFPNHPQAPAQRPLVPRLLRGSPGVVRAISVPEPRVVQITLAQPYAPLLTVLAHPALAIGLALDGGARWVGTGPFAPLEGGPGRWLLEAHRAYWAGAPRLGRLVFLERPDAGAATLEAREVDVLVPASAPPTLAGALSVPAWRVGYLALQTEREPFARPRARQAVAAALDPATLGTALEPMAAPLGSFLPPGVWGRADGASLHGADPARSRRLLAEAKLPRGVAFTLLNAAPPLDGERLLEALRAGLAGAGIAVHLAPESPAEAYRLAQQGEHQAVLLEAEVLGGDPHLFLYPLSTSEGAVKGPAAGNLSFYRHPRLDDLLIRASQLSFRPERQRVYARAQALLAEEVPWLPLYVRLHWVVARPEVRHLRLHPSGYHRFDRVVLEASAAPAR